MPPAPSSPLLRRTLAVGAAAGATAISLRALLRPRAPEMEGLVRWDRVRELAVERSGEPAGRWPESERLELAAGYDLVARDLAPPMAEVCQMVPDRFPAFRVLDRHGFIDANLELARRLLDPVERLRATLPESRASLLGRSALTRYLGELFGLVSRRVLGQYDPVLTLGSGSSPEAATALYLIEPNVLAFERDQGAPRLPLRRWLILHELTHAWQFESHPWLRQHLAGLVDELVSSSLRPALERQGRSPRAVLGQMPRVVRAQLAGAARIQAVMSVLEGYSNFVMHRVGRRHIAEAARLEAAFERRQRQRTVVERLLAALTGMSIKLRQYELGESFASAVADRSGLALLNRVWEGPEQMPSLAELRRPELWMARLGG